MTRLLITGASGMLGANLALLAQNRGYEVLGWTNSRPLVDAPFTTHAVDFSDQQALAQAFKAAEPNALINCAAQANVDAAEKQPEHAFRINAEAAGELAQMARAANVPMIQVSTDAVFDGTQGDYKENDAPNPLNTYAKSKLAGEQAVAEANPEAAIARVVFYGWSLTGTRSLAEFFYNNLSAGKPVNGFTDMFFSPLYVGHLAEALLEMLEKRLCGIYHVYAPESLSKYDYGVRLAHEFGLDASLIRPISALNSDLLTRRSLNLSMNTDKLQAALGKPLQNQAEGLRALHADLDSGLRQKLLSLNH
ncbi:MAG TPA: SDR family oxidoreductase [Anaerolineaceae bacterium]|nr:SDR family oxidoreductase [Anaerolineaceae bacterium]